MRPSLQLQIKVTLRSLSSDTTNLPAEIRRIATASSFGLMDGTKDTDWIWLAFWGRGVAFSPSGVMLITIPIRPTTLF